MKIWDVSINWLGIILIPIWVLAFIKTWGTPVFWVLLMISIKDMNITSKHEAR